MTKQVRTGSDYVDSEKVIRAYECCGNPFNRKCEKCPYEEDCCHDGIPMFVIRKMVELLKEQEQRIKELEDELKFPRTPSYEIPCI